MPFAAVEVFPRLYCVLVKSNAAGGQNRIKANIPEITAMVSVTFEILIKWT